MPSVPHQLMYIRPCQMPLLDGCDAVPLVDSTSPTRHFTGLCRTTRSLEHQMLATFTAPTPRVLGVTLSRGRGPDFSQRDGLMLTLLRPHQAGLVDWCGPCRRWDAPPRLRSSTSRATLSAAGERRSTRRGWSIRRRARRAPDGNRRHGTRRSGRRGRRYGDYREPGVVFKEHRYDRDLEREGCPRQRSRRRDRSCDRVGVRRSRRIGGFLLTAMSRRSARAPRGSALRATTRSA